MRAKSAVETKENFQERVPLVSVIVPVRNEQEHIIQCLTSILGNDYPQECLEILVVDGMSTDRSREIIRRYAQDSPRIRLVDNPKRIQAAAMNIGIREAKGDVIIRIDAHTVYGSDYISQCVKLLQDTVAANVGGVQHAVGTNYVTSAIALAITSPFGVGDAKFRYASEHAWVDTVYLGAWHKRTLEAVGGFAEEWVINEDYELNYRLRRNGGKILLAPQVRCQYRVRESLYGLAHQYFWYGVWRVKTMVAHPGSVRWRQLVPPLFVASFLISLASLPLLGAWGLVIPGFYAMATVTASVHGARRGGWRYLPVLPAVFGTLHFSWGTGFYVGILRWGLPRVQLRRSLQNLQGRNAIDLELEEKPARATDVD